MSDKIFLRRGNRADLPALNPAEPGFAMDTKQMFIGAAGGNVGLINALSGGFKVQSGTGSVNVTANNFTTQPVTFPASFGSNPVVLISMAVTFGPSTWAYVTSSGPTTTGFTAGCESNSSGTIYFNWVAIGS